ncbi:MAG: class I SAM-dependent methyltransferase [Calditrichia bacterium]
MTIDAMDISGKMVELARETAANLGLSATVSHCDLQDFWTGKTYV